MDKVELFFNEEKHKYTDSLGNPYTSATQLIHKYVVPFDTVKMSRICYQSGLKGNPKYKGKSLEQIRREWDDARELGCSEGTKKHDFIETAIKTANGYKKVAGTLFINDKIYTIQDILVDHDYGRIDLDFFITTGIKEKYPKIYHWLERLTLNGFKIYAEIGGFNISYLVSGLIDLLLVKDDKFIIFDWKTNKGGIRFDAGYWDKNRDGSLTGEYITQRKYMKYPLHNLEDSVGNHYTIQLSIYDYLVEGYGLKCLGNMLFHIRHELYTNGDKDVIENPDWIGKAKVDILNIKYLKEDVMKMFSHYKESNRTKLVTQTALM